MKTSALVLAAIFALVLALHFFEPGISATAVSPPDSPPADRPLVFESGSRRVTLVELFTSQGCSSCPPADAFLSKKLRADGLWKKYVPVAWHVDYWDRLGWPDPLASADHTRRQYAHRDAGHATSVYTPGFFLNGGEWRGFFQRRDLPEQSSAEATPELRVTVDGASVRVQISGWEKSPAAPDAGAEIHLAELGFGIRTEVPRGENAGRTLVNDFVVLHHQSKKTAAGARQAEFTFDTGKASARSKASHLAVAVWLTLPGDLVPLQATGGWLPGDQDH